MLKNLVFRVKMKLFSSEFFENLFTKPIANRHELLAKLAQAADAGVFDKDSLPLLEAVVQFGDMRAKDILLPRHEIATLDIHSQAAEIIHLIVSTGHSRFPVVDGSINNIIGVFHSKDLVKYLANLEQFELQALLREPLFIPDSKPLDSLLYEMRLKRCHLAIVVDEFTNVAGMITLEMIVEQIIGEIDDEYDLLDGEHSVVEVSHKLYRAKGHCGLEQFNNLTGQCWHDDKVESVGGYISKTLGRIPKNGDVFSLNQCQIEICSSDSRKINILNVLVP